MGVVPSADEVGGQSPAPPTRSWERWEGSAEGTRHPPPTLPTPALRAASPNPPALWRSRDGSRPKAARGRVGWVWSLAPTKSGKARLRQRDHGNVGRVPPRALGTHPPPTLPTPALRAASPNPPALWLRRAKPAYAYAIRRKPWKVPRRLRTRLHLYISTSQAEGTSRCGRGCRVAPPCWAAPPVRRA